MMNKVKRLLEGHLLSVLFVIKTAYDEIGNFYTFLMFITRGHSHNV